MNQRRHPIDWLVGGYLLLTLLLLLISPPTSSATSLFVFRGIMFALIAIAWISPPPTHPVLRFLRVAYPGLLFGQFYAELDVLNTCVTSSRFDDVVVLWEQRLFRSMPSVDLRRWLPWWPIAEFVHIGYLAYYLMVPAISVALVIKRDLAAVSESVFAITATFIACYVCFITIPVVGPFHYLEPPDPSDVGRFLPQLTQRILHAGSSVGTAFPSSHVAVGTAVALAAVRHTKWFGRVMVLLTVMMAVGAVYGGYHYAIDAGVGALLGIVVAPIARARWRRWGGYPGDEDAARVPSSLR